MRSRRAASRREATKEKPYPGQSASAYIGSPTATVGLFPVKCIAHEHSQHTHGDMLSAVAARCCWGLAAAGGSQAGPMRGGVRSAARLARPATLSWVALSPPAVPTGSRCRGSAAAPSSQASCRRRRRLAAASLPRGGRARHLVVHAAAAEGAAEGAMTPATEMEGLHAVPKPPAEWDVGRGLHSLTSQLNLRTFGTHRSR